MIYLTIMIELSYEISLDIDHKTVELVALPDFNSCVPWTSCQPSKTPIHAWNRIPKFKVIKIEKNQQNIIYEIIW